MRGVKIREGKLPPRPGVYLMKDVRGTVIYVGKAASLKTRVSSYFNRPQDVRISLLVSEIRSIDYQLTPSALEALILEAKLIKKLHPKYNVREQDDKSFLSVVITADIYPKVLLARGQEIKIYESQTKSRIFGPFTSASAVRAALRILRRIFHWSNCPAPPFLSSRVRPGGRGDLISARDGIASSHAPRNDTISRPCFYYHLGQCPGICIGAIRPPEYRRQVIRPLVLFFEGKKAQVMKDVESRMKNVAKKEKFEEAEALKRQLFSLCHIRDTAVLTREPNHHRAQERINIFGRIEGYDISNISGTSAVGSMVVFEGGEPAKSEYRKFKIKTVSGINDVAMMREVLSRRFKRAKQSEWPMPELLVIDGGVGQVRTAMSALAEYKIDVPVIGIAKGFKRKQDRPVYSGGNPDLARIVENHKDLLLRARDEAHRFAVAYHRKRRSTDFLGRG